jgi:hypothetical protein
MEPSADLEAAAPDELADGLRAYLAILPATDVAIGWRAAPAQLEAMRRAVPDRVALWRWVPVFAGGWERREGLGPPALGSGGVGPLPFRDMGDFRFHCLVQPAVVDEAIERILALVAEVGATGALLDRMRWPSPSGDPATDLCCFCDVCAEHAAVAGLDLRTVAAELADASRELVGRRRVVETLFGRYRGTTLGAFLTWRAERVTSAMRAIVDVLRGRGLLVGYDVFSPAIAYTVGQDLALLSAADLVKSMTYLDAQGPASLPFEIAGYVRWLEAAGDSGEADLMAELLGFRLPVEGAAPEVRADILVLEGKRLAAAVGPHGLIGLDVVELPGVLSIDDAVVRARVAAIRRSGFGIAPSWDARLMSPRRIASIGAAWSS